MQNRKLFDLIILGIWLFIAIIITVDYNIKTSPIEVNQTIALQPNSEIEVEKISLIDENSIDLILKDKNKSRVILFLPLKVNKEKISEILSKSSDKKVIFYENGRKINLKLFFKGKEITISQCLEETP